ncbi:penicillin-binding protein 2 [Desulfofalx alkaliphila]|uniref:penicillin-binding protein 2 n=1 Tax=Desulfofalx alkaliphila TaxID=105483 RepID=UPI0004E22304|nr:penicillin-binding protein 2 [Desulfofalx alkaliphila]
MERKVIKQKTKVFTAIVVAVFLILAGRLAYLQFFHVDKYQTLAQQNHMRLIHIPAPRGEMLARDGQTKIVSNQPVYTVSLVYLGLKNIGLVVERLAEILDMSPDEIHEKLEAQKLRLYQPVRIVSNVPLETVLEIEQHRLELPGVVIDVEPVRSYPQGSIASHLTGYVQEINEEQLKENEEKGYRLGDMYGQTGLEYMYEEYLRGTPGARQVEVDAMARPVRDLGISQPVPGNNLILTIDHKVQQAAERALEAQIETLQQQYPDAHAGAVVVLDVHTGGVIAMASYPTYDPTVFAQRLTEDMLAELYDPVAQRFNNRALIAYPPGSTYKMAVIAAGLETGVIQPDTKVFDPGYKIVDGESYRCWLHGGHGNVDAIKSLKVSCNTYYYHFGLEMGHQAMAEYAAQLGLGTVLGIDLPGEQRGVLPTPENKYRLFKQYLTAEKQQLLDEIEERYDALMAAAATEEERRRLRSQLRNERLGIHWELEWHNYDTVISSIGQGISKYTPLQLAAFTATIANGGTLYKPHLVKEIVDHKRRSVKKFSPEVIRRVDISPENLAIIREGMAQVTQAGGTAPLFNDIPVPVAAKTGTAEVQGRDNHGLMVAYAPADNPQIAVAAVIEHAGRGGGGAGPVVHDVLAAYFGGKPMEGQLLYTPD